MTAGREIMTKDEDIEFFSKLYESLETGETQDMLRRVLEEQGVNVDALLERGTKLLRKGRTP